MTKTVAGGCLCGSVRFEVQDNFENFLLLSL